MESVVRPASWAAFPGPARGLFEALRSPAGEQMVLEDNFFVEQMLPGGIKRTLSDQEMAEYRRPYLRAGEDRRAMLTWPRQIPIDGDPADVAADVAAYAAWLEHAEVPKLLISADPGAALTGAQLDYARSWPNQDEVTVPGLHFIQEDSPGQIGQAIATWLRGLR
jgi:haloalkane dehalogenase